MAGRRSFCQAGLCKQRSPHVQDLPRPPNTSKGLPRSKTLQAVLRAFQDPPRASTTFQWHPHISKSAPRPGLTTAFQGIPRHSDDARRRPTGSASPCRVGPTVYRALLNGSQDLHGPIGGSQWLPSGVQSPPKGFRRMSLQRLPETLHRFPGASQNIQLATASRAPRFVLHPTPSFPLGSGLCAEVWARESPSDRGRGHRQTEVEAGDIQCAGQRSIALETTADTSGAVSELQKATGGRPCRSAQAAAEALARAGVDAASAVGQGAWSTPTAIPATSMARPAHADPPPRPVPPHAPDGHAGRATPLRHPNLGRHPSRGEGGFVGRAPSGQVVFRLGAFPRARSTLWCIFPCHRRFPCHRPSGAGPGPGRRRWGARARAPFLARYSGGVRLPVGRAAAPTRTAAQATWAWRRSAWRRSGQATRSPRSPARGAPPL